MVPLLIPPARTALTALPWLVAGLLWPSLAVAGYTVDQIAYAARRGYSPETLVHMAETTPPLSLSAETAVELLRSGVPAQAITTLTAGALPTSTELAAAAHSGPEYTYQALVPPEPLAALQPDHALAYPPTRPPLSPVLVAGVGAAAVVTGPAALMLEAWRVDLYDFRVDLYGLQDGTSSPLGVVGLGAVYAGPALLAAGSQWQCRALARRGASVSCHYARGAWTAYGVSVAMMLMWERPHVPVLPAIAALAYVSASGAGMLQLVENRRAARSLKDQWAGQARGRWRAALTPVLDTERVGLAAVGTF